MSFSVSVKENMLVSCARHCCICHRFCGLKIELHHINFKSEGGQDNIENCIALCFDCHGDMRSYDAKHPKGTKYTPEELKKHRDAWLTRVTGTPLQAYSQDNLILDRKTFIKICEMLPWKGTVEYVSRLNFSGYQFLVGKFDPFLNFYFSCEDPYLEFIDPELERFRADLLAGVDELTERVAVDTFPANAERGTNSVPAEWEYEQPERFARVVGQLHAAASKVVDSYRQLVSAGRRKLGVSPD